jgi:hypothetical protein
MALSTSSLQKKLTAFHRAKADRQLGLSPIAGPQFAKTFNLGAFSRPLFQLPDTPSSFWGVDRCLRIEEAIDPWHARIFHVTLFARSIEREGHFKTPWRDPRFHSFQTEILTQFFSLLEYLSLDPRMLEATYFAGADVGGHPDGKDRLVKEERRIPGDHITRDFLRRRKVKAIPSTSLMNLDLAAMEGALVGPRVELFFEGLELGVIHFDYFKLRKGRLQPINYLAAYALGIERVIALSNRSDFLQSIRRYVLARKIIEKQVRVARSPALKREVMSVLYGLEALAFIPERLSAPRRRLVTEMKARMKRDIHDLGLSFENVSDLFSFFLNWKY